MHCVITAGPTYEPLDSVRRLTNFSTGRLGSELANFLQSRGHEVTLLIGEQATYHGECQASRRETFTTTASLRQQLQACAKQSVDAIFHAAAVSDFTFAKTWHRTSQGELVEVKAGKIPTRLGSLLVELVPTPKLIAELRAWFPSASLVGWKYEVDGDRAGVVALAQQQIAQCGIDACVANGPAYGSGFGLVRPPAAPVHLADTAALFPALDGLLSA